jgi:hypothetical protein
MKLFLLIVFAGVSATLCVKGQNPVPAVPYDCDGSGCPQWVCPDGLKPITSTLNADGTIGPQTACDPAFITYDRAWSLLRETVVGVRGGTSTALGAVSAEAEMALAKTLDEVKTPDRAWAVVAEAWRSGVSAGFQRQALAVVRSMAKRSADTETLNFMLSALENPTVELERCRQLSRGTAPEKRKAADRLALLLQNPNLADLLK